jgi:hypothetical protein
MVTGWVGISGTVALSTQTRWLGFGIGSLILAGFAMVGWLVTGMLRIAALRRAVVAALNARGAAVKATAAPDSVGSTEYGVAPGMRRYHRPGCRLLMDKQVKFDSVGVHVAAGRGACGICAPPAEPLG